MYTIEGIGDEVAISLIVIVVALIGLFAWMTTNVEDISPWTRLGYDIYYTTVNRVASARVNEQNDEESDISVENQEAGEVNNEQDSSASNLHATSGSSESIVINEESFSIPTDETPSCSNISESLRNRKDTSKSKVNVNIAQKTDESVSEPAQIETSNSGELDSELSNKIKIKLKFLDDALRIVDGTLEEPLGDFKRRHFAVDLSMNKLVRFIFNGQLLSSDSNTLRHYGFFDNCVVHCQVVHNLPPVESSSSIDPEDSVFDIGYLMIPVFSAVICLLWYCWFQLNHYFHAPSSIILISITGLLVLLTYAMYSPRTEQSGSHYQVGSRPNS